MKKKYVVDSHKRLHPVKMGNRRFFVRLRCINMRTHVRSKAA